MQTEDNIDVFLRDAQVLLFNYFYFRQAITPKVYVAILILN